MPGMVGIPHPATEIGFGMLTRSGSGGETVTLTATKNSRPRTAARASRAGRDRPPYEGEIPASIAVRTPGEPAGREGAPYEGEIPASIAARTPGWPTRRKYPAIAAVALPSDLGRDSEKGSHGGGRGVEVVAT